MDLSYPIKVETRAVLQLALDRLPFQKPLHPVSSSLRFGMVQETLDKFKTCCAAVRTGMQKK
jgi:hypothetical protein